MNKSFENKMSPALSMFNHIYKEFNEIYHEATLKMGLSDSAFDILYSIVDLGDGCSQSDICKYSCLSKQTVNSSIKKMASLNYLTFKPGKGYGKELYEALEKALKAQNITNLYACIGYPEVEDQYLTKNSVQYHEHLGYRFIGTFKKCGYKFNRWYDMVWMEKMIGEHSKNQKEVILFREIEKNYEL